MKYGVMGPFVKLAFAKTAFGYLEEQLPDLDMARYKRRALLEYKAIVARTSSVGPMRNNMFVVSMYAAAFVIALYKTEPELLTPDVLQGLVKAASYCPLMRAAKEGKSAFTEKEIRTRTEQAAWSREHISEYPMNWYWFFEKMPDEDECYITHKQCGLCKLAQQEAAGKSGLFSGVVESQEYYGLFIKYTIRAAGQTLKVVEKNGSLSIFEPGDAVNLYIDPVDIMSY